MADNPALIAGLGAGRAVVPVYVLDEETEGCRPRGAASRWWLHQSLQSLDASLRALGSRLILRRGPAERVIGDLAAECEAQAVYWNRVYDLGSRERDGRLKRSLSSRGVAVESFKGNLLFEPWEVKTLDGQPFKVFTPFWRACRSQPSPDRPLSVPGQLPGLAQWPASDALAAWQLTPHAPDWSGGLQAAWTPGEARAIDRLTAFLDDVLRRYHMV
ncbi:MAG: deoxyribodipyrimidine photo-lyase, partial [Solimonas sp.]